MSRELQRVVVRMLYDPAFVIAVYRDAAAATADIPLTAAQRRWLTEPDRRAWTIDRQRRARTLAALIDEYPAVTRAAEAVDAFFSSTVFHRCIQTRGSLALAYGRFVVDHFADEPWVQALAQLEVAIAHLRRRKAPALEAGQIALHRRVMPHWGPSGLADVYVAVMAGSRPPGDLIVERSEGLIAELGDGGAVSISKSSPELFALLEAALTPLDRRELEKVACGFGCDASEAHELLDDLLAEGLLASLGSSS